MNPINIDKAQWYKLTGMFDNAEVVRTGNDPDKCYFADGREPVIWASFAIVIKNRLKNSTIEKIKL